ncbi:MAG: glycosyltransferase family 4 protein [Pirellulaceae bacterium]|nr:glycosyltransferase family 4 protein [Pirellulaceae bacterium]
MNARVAYVVKRYPRFSETFIVNEILAHEASGLAIDIFSLRPPVDTHFQDLISRVRAPLTYLSDGQVKAADLWAAMRKASGIVSDFTEGIEKALTCNSVLDVYCGVELAIHCIKRGVTHIHAHFASSPASVAQIASHLTGIPFSITAHAKDIFHESVDEGDLERKLSEAKVTFTVSEFNLAFLRERYPAAAQRIIRLYNGMHLKDFPYGSPQDRKPKIVAVGRFVEKKGFDDLIQACAILRDHHVPFECQMIGGGELEHSLGQLVERLHLSEQVQLLGPQPQNVVKKFISEASLMAAPCVHGQDGNRDGLPTVLLEAMALGTPCISTAVTGIPEVVRHGSTGMIVAEHSPQELAKSIENLLTDSQRRCQYSMAARQLIENEFDIERNTECQRSYFEGASQRRLASQPATRTLAEVG